MARARTIVLTGGPGAGKTAVLELVRRRYGDKVVILRESASILYGGGFPRDGTPITRRAAQRAIYHVQRELERIAEEQDGDNIVLCDRGTLDGLAYWPDAPEAWFRELGTTLKAEYSRYDVVLHMRSPMSGNGYNHANPLRLENAEEAHAIDERIAEIWAEHPRRIFLPAEQDFLAKAAHALEIIAEEISQRPSLHPTRPV